MRIYLIFFLLVSFNFTFANAGDQLRTLEGFNNWLWQNGHNQYLEINKDYEECKDCTRFFATATCYEEDGKPKKQCVLDGDQGSSKNGFKWADHRKYKNKLKIKFYKNRWTLPWDSKPKFGTLLYFFYKYNFSHFSINSNTKQWDRYEVQPSNNSIEFDKDLIEDKYIKKQLQKTSILSYLFYEDGKVTIDELSPNDRFGSFVNNETKLRSMSVGKTMVSYVMGHAICKGYIDSVDSKINDWSLVNNTLYQDQKIIDLLNMSAGDQKYLETSNFKDGGDTDTSTMSELMIKMSNKQKSNKKYNYNGLLPHLLLNYILFKSGDDFELLLNDIFQDDVKIKNSIYFYKHPNKSKDDGNANSMFYATRYDYLRIAKTMLDNWNNDTCVGKYLKTLYKNKVRKNDEWRDEQSSWFNPKGYAGFFHTDYSGMSKRSVMGMDGYGGQSIIIDFDLGRIIVINSIHQNYNWKKIAHSVIKKSK